MSSEKFQAPMFKGLERNKPKNQEFLLWEVMTEQDGSFLVLAEKSCDLR